MDVSLDKKKKTIYTTTCNKIFRAKCEEDLGIRKIEDIKVTYLAGRG